MKTSRVKVDFFGGDNEQYWGQQLWSTVERICGRDRIPYVDFYKLIDAKRSNRGYVKFNAINNVMTGKIKDDSIVTFLRVLLKEMEGRDLFSKGKAESASDKFNRDRISMFQQHHDEMFNRGNNYTCSISFDRKQAREDASTGLVSLLAVCYYLLTAEGGRFADTPLNEIPEKYLDFAKRESENKTDEKMKTIIDAIKVALGMKLGDEKPAEKVVYKSGEFKNDPFNDALSALRDIEDFNDSAPKQDDVYGSHEMVMDKNRFSPSYVLRRALDVYNNYEIGSSDDMEAWMKSVIQNKILKTKISWDKRIQTTYDFLDKRLNFEIIVKEKRNGNMVEGYGIEMSYLIPEKMFDGYKKFFDKSPLTAFCFMPPIKELYELLGLFADQPGSVVANVSLARSEKNRKEINEIVIDATTKWRPEQYISVRDLKSSPKIVKLIDLLMDLQNNMFQVKIIEEEQAPSNWSKYINILADKVNQTKSVEPVAAPETPEDISGNVELSVEPKPESEPVVQQTPQDDFDDSGAPVDDWDDD